MTNRIALIEAQPTQEDIDDCWEFCKVIRQIGVIETWELDLGALEDWCEEEQKRLDDLSCQGIE